MKKLSRNQKLARKLISKAKQRVRKLKRKGWDKQRFAESLAKLLWE